MVEPEAGQFDPAGHVARLFLLGPVRLFDAEGRDRTPRGSFLRALLAVLALSRHGTKSRTKLQDLLWGSRDQEQGSQSLRTALSTLKRELAGFPISLVEADQQVVRLNVARIWIDVFEYTAGTDGRLLRQEHPGELPDLLEGLSVRASQDDAFEDWLRDERLHWGEKLERLHGAMVDAEDAYEPELVQRRPPAPEAALARGPSPGDSAELRPDLSTATFAVGLLPTIVRGPSPAAAFFGDTVLDCIGTGLRDLVLADIYDYRQGAARPNASVRGPGPPVLLQTKVYEHRDKLFLTLLVHQASGQKLLWSWSAEFSCHEDLSLENRAVATFVNQAIDRVCLSLEKPSVASPTACTPFHALNTIFQLDVASFSSMRAVLTDVYEETRDPVYLSLLAYLNTFRVGEGWETFDQGVIEETQGFVERILAENPFNSLALTLAGHACGYILHNHALALDLLGRATEINPHLAVGWDHLAVNHLYCGHVEEATRAVETAVRLGRFSPLRFTYDTTLCMIATIKGDYATAVKHGERALAHRPQFGAPLRYTAASLGHLGEHDTARRLVSRIRALDPDFSSEWALVGRLALADDDAKSRLLIGLRKAGA